MCHFRCKNNNTVIQCLSSLDSELSEQIVQPLTRGVHETRLALESIRLESEYCARTQTNALTGVWSYTGDFDHATLKAHIFYKVGRKYFWLVSFKKA